MVAFIYNEKHEFFAAQRSPNKSFLPNKWELVGGRLEPGENELEGLKREINEELGIDIIIEERFFELPFKLDKNTDAIEAVYFAKMKDPNQEIKILEDEIQDYKWMSENEFADYYDKDLPEFQAIEKGFKILSDKK